MRANLLDGVTVLDMTNVLAGPFAAYQLALLGADVLKIETPGHGDLARNLGASPELSSLNMGISFLAQNSSKGSMTLNLKSEQGKEVFRKLVAEADVVVENFRPGVMDRLGFGWEVLRELNPRLVYCAISGFGQTGPERLRPAYDQVIQGLSGLMAVTGSEETAPLRVGAPLCDTIGGFAAAFGIAAALHRVNASGEGAFLDVSMLEASMTAMGWVVSDYLVGGRVPIPMGNENRTAAPSGTFRTADGALNIAANKQEQFEALCGVIGRPELIDDPRFCTRELRKENRLELRDEIEVSLVHRSAEEWDRLLLPVGVPAAPVFTVAEVLEWPHLEERGLVAEFDTDLPLEGSLRLMGGAIHVDEKPVTPDQAPPALGRDTEAVLARLGYDDDAIAAMRATGVV